MLENFYLIVMIVGFGYLLFSFLLGQISDVIGGISGHEIDVGHPDHAGFGHIGHDVHLDQGDLDHHLEYTHEMGDSDSPEHQFNHVSPLNPLTIAAFLTIFGAAGLSTSYQEYPPALTILISLIVSLAAGLFVWSLLSIIARKAGTSSVSERTLVGLQGDVIITIPEKGHGEVRLLVNDQVVAFPASSTEGEIRSGDHVQVIQAEGGILTVGRSTRY